MLKDKFKCIYILQDNLKYHLIDSLVYRILEAHSAEVNSMNACIICIYVHVYIYTHIQI